MRDGGKKKLKRRGEEDKLLTVSHCLVYPVRWTRTFTSKGGRESEEVLLQYIPGPENRRQKTLRTLGYTKV